MILGPELTGTTGAKEERKVKVQGEEVQWRSGEAIDVKPAVNLSKRRLVRGLNWGRSQTVGERELREEVASRERQSDAGANR